MYEEFYGLTSKPFQLTPDPRFFYLSSGHKRAMSYMRYGLSQGEGFIVVTGDIGTGKTTLVQTLFDELDKDQIVAVQIVTTQLKDDDLLRLVVAAFGLPYEGLGKGDLLKSFEDFLRIQKRAGKRCLLIVDEAQNLPIRTLEELRMLSNFEMDNRPLLQSFLVGQKEFRIILQSPSLEQLKQRVIASCDLRPLKEDEIEEYMEHRLTLAGWNNNPRFNEDVFPVISAATQGIPRRINLLCDRILLFGYLEEVDVITADIARAVANELSEELAPVPGTANSGAFPAGGVFSGQGLRAPTNDGQGIPVEGLSMEQRVSRLESFAEVIRLTAKQQAVFFDNLFGSKRN